MSLLIILAGLGAIIAAGFNVSVTAGLFITGAVLVLVGIGAARGDA